MALRCETKTDELHFNSNQALLSDCTINSSATWWKTSDLISNADYISASVDSSITYYIYLCKYDKNGVSQGRSQYQYTIDTDLDLDYDYRITYRYDNNHKFLTNSVRYCYNESNIQPIVNNLNDITENDIYSEIVPIIPFLSTLVIFSFAYFVLCRVIKSSSRGDSNV